MARGSLLRQLGALLRRNLIIKRRNKKETAQEVFFPVYYVLILAIIRVSISPSQKPAIPSFSEHKLIHSAPELLEGDILVSPNTSQIDEFMEKVVDMLAAEFITQSATYTLFDSFEEAEEMYKTNSTLVAAGIHFADGSLDKYEYTLRLPYTELAKTDSHIYGSQGECRVLDGLDKGPSCPGNSYFHSGFSLLQSVIDTIFIQWDTQEHNFPLPETLVRLFPKSEWTPDVSYLQMLASIYFVLAYSPFVNFLMVNLVAEKEKKIKEGMRMMGMRDAALWISWGLTYALIIFIVTVICVLLSWAFKFFQNSTMFLFFLILFLYGLTIITMSFALTPFFEKAETAGAIASLATLAFSLLYLAVSMTRTSYNDEGPVSSISTEGQWALSLLSPVALALAIDQGVFLDIAHDGMHFHTMHIGQFPLYASMTMLAVDFVLYGLLAIYFDNVIPGEYGQKRPPWYLFLPSYWCPKKNGSHEAQYLMENIDGELHSTSYIPSRTSTTEPVQQELKNKDVLRLFSLRKTFKVQKKENVAVDGICLDVYEGQITALLGHNGAGKTTLLNMLTGLTPPTSGNALLYEYDVSDNNDMDEIRSMTGVCPQHNILFDTLTCTEHLQFYGAIKGVVGKDMDAEIQKALEDVDMLDQKNTASLKLSGGQKRKLSVAIALIGDPKVLFLDEPTAGMDPYSRRHLWGLLREKKAGRLIILTTHFMDEADILADRKVFLSKGKLKCAGSSLFLKNRFGVGYHLGLVVESVDKADKITELIKRHVTDAQLDRIHAKEVTYTLPLTSVNHFSDLFAALEQTIIPDYSDESLGISSFGVSMTTLEEVFLKIGVEEAVDDDTGENLEIEDEATAASTQVQPEDRSRKLHTSVNVEEPNVTGQRVTLMDPANARSTEKLTSQRFWALLKLRFLLLRRSKMTLFFRILIPVVFILIGVSLRKFAHSTPVDVTPDPLPLSASLYANVNNVSESHSNPNMTYAVSPTGGLNSSDFVKHLYSQGIGQTMVKYPDLLDLAPHHLGTDIQNVVANGKIVECKVAALYNDTATHSLPVTINVISNSLLRMVTSSPSQRKDIKVLSQPWPHIVSATGVLGAFDYNMFSSTFMLGLALAFIPAAFANGVVRDRVRKSRSQLRISGVSLNMYWVTTFLPDILQFSCASVLSITVLLAFQVETIMNGGAIVALILVYATYMPVNTLLAYVLSFAFKTVETAQTVIPNLFILSGFLPFMVVALLDMSRQFEAAAILHYVCCILFPAYTVFGGLYYIDRVYYEAMFTQGPNPDLSFDDYFAWDSHILIAIIAPVFHAIWMYFLLRFLEVKSSGGDWRDVFWCGSGYGSRGQVIEDNQDVELDEEIDVAEERRKVESRDPTSPQAPVVMVKGLRKEFNVGKRRCCKKTDRVKVAVRNASFAVETREVFGLLGPNGAGKTTTLNMIIADEGPTIGKVYAAGHDIKSSLSEVFQNMGYCPQHDALWDGITLREHLECYAAVRGINKNDIPGVVNYFITNLRVEDHANKIAKKLSGGTKRKLSYAISMLGEPQVVLLDEPSTGMDPKSKRFLWDTISAAFDNTDRGAILTTHYMEEADALCTRVGIMVNGQLQCLGSTQHLKNKYGSGYTLELKLDDCSMESQEVRMTQLHGHVLELFPDATRTECFAERATYKIPQDTTGVLSNTFKAFEEAKTPLGIEEYSFSQSTLEQVFIQFAKHQVEEDTQNSDHQDAAGQSTSTNGRDITEPDQTAPTEV